MRAVMVISVQLQGTGVWVDSYTESCCEDEEAGGTSGTFKENTAHLLFVVPSVRVEGTRTWVDQTRKPET